MNNLETYPDIIYLQVGDTENTTPKYQDISEVTWCEDKIYNGDVAYIRIDLAENV